MITGLVVGVVLGVVFHKHIVKGTNTAVDKVKSGFKDDSTK